jgi:AI-2 transport protein TqsA
LKGEARFLKDIRNILLIFFLGFSFYMMKVLYSILIPLVLAIFAVLLAHPAAAKLEKIKVPRYFVMPVISAILLLAVFLIANIFIATFRQFSNEQEMLMTQLLNRVESIESAIPFFEDEAELDLNEMIKRLIDRDFITSLVGTTAKNLGSFGGSFFMFALYFVILLNSISASEMYVKKVLGSEIPSGVEKFQKIRSSLSSYMGIKFVISAATGIFAGIVCYFFGLKFALFFGFLTFLLNFIPSIGSIIATIPPVLMGFIQFDSSWRTITLLIILMVIQFTIGNIIEPLVMGSKMRLNTVTVLFGLVFWGFIWGIPGMIASVPLVMIIKLICEESESLSIVARIMSPVSRENTKKIVEAVKKEL